MDRGFTAAERSCTHAHGTTRFNDIFTAYFYAFFNFVPHEKFPLFRQKIFISMSKKGEL